jgi:hypothetical protein
MRTVFLASFTLLSAVPPSAGACTFIDPCWDIAAVEFWEPLGVELVDGDPDATPPAFLDRDARVFVDGYGEVQSVEVGDVRLSWD